MIAPTKQCRTCRLVKPLGDFHRQQRYPDGRSIRCRECVNLATRKRRHNHHSAGDELLPLETEAVRIVRERHAAELERERLVELDRQVEALFRAHREDAAR